MHLFTNVECYCVNKQTYEKLMPLSRTIAEHSPRIRREFARNFGETRGRF